MRKSLARDESGVSLVELLISLVIFTTALMAPAQLMTMGVATSYQSQARSDAVSLVKFQLETFKAVSFDNAILVAGGSLPPAATVAGYSEQVDGTGQVVANLSLHTRGCRPHADSEADHGGRHQEWSDHGQTGHRPDHHVAHPRIEP